MKYLLYLLLFILSACISESHQKDKPGPDSPFWNDIQNFKKQDSISFPQPNAILFIGSSSFTMWKGVQDSFPDYTIINRGFGGSTLLDQILYVKDIVFPYYPKQIIIYCGENDLASSDSVTATMILDRFDELFHIIRGKFSGIPVAYVSMKPSPSRRHLFSKMREGNQLIKNFLRSQKKAAFIDVHQPMLNETGEPIPEIFLDDSLHMNAKGYAIWKKTIEPYLKK
jgi:lysophospholipase L1-like esterase